MIISFDSDDLLRQLEAQIAHCERQIAACRAQIDLIAQMRASAVTIEESPDAPPAPAPALPAAPGAISAQG